MRSRSRRAATPSPRATGASLLLLLLLTLLPLAPATAATPDAAVPGAAAADGTTPSHSVRAPFHARVRQQGIDVDVSMDSLEGLDELRQGDFVKVRVEVTDSNTGKPYSALYPAAWLDRLPPAGDPDEEPCRAKVQGFIGGSILSQAEVDLNVYYVLALNEDATISVVDPLFGFGGSKLLTLIVMKSPGEDWALDADQARLFVTMPEVDEVAVAETLSWDVVTNIPVGPHPERIELQPDGTFLWVGYRGDGETTGGVSVVSTKALREVARIPTGAGPHDVTFSDDHRHVYVSNAGDGTVSVIDAGRREVVATVETGRRPLSLAWSTAAGALYVSDQADGTVTAIDGDSHQVSAVMRSEPGLEQIRFAPGGRYALVVNPRTDSLLVVDAAANRVVQNGEVEDQPDQVAFTDELAYVRHRGSEIVLMVPLATLGDEDKPLQVIDFPGGTHPPGRADRPTLADGMVQAPGAPAMLVANQEDGAIYFYKEGMAAPMGHFKNYGRRPRAVTVVDRSLRETRPGVYETAVRLRRPGNYDLAFFLDSPRIIHCFPLAIDADPELRRAPGPRVRIAQTTPRRTLRAGEPAELTFRLTDPASGQPIEEPAELTVLTVQAPGRWHRRGTAEPMGDGEYRIDFTPPSPGIYYVYAGNQELGAPLNRTPYRIFRAVASEASEVSDSADAGGGGDLGE